MVLFFQLLLVSLGGVLACYGVGAGAGRLLGVAPRERFFALFFTLVLGLVTLVSVYAVVRTGGRSILLPLLLLVLLAGWQLRRRASDEAPLVDSPAPERTGLTALPLALAYGLVIFSARWLLLYDPESPFLRTPFQDYVYYGRLYSPLQQMGLETSVLETLYPQFMTTMPYHYVEVWFNIVLVRLTGLPTVWCLYLAAYSALVTLVAVGFRAALAHFGVQRLGATLLAPVLVLVTGVFWPFFAGHPFFENGTLVASTLLPIQPKLAPVYLLTLLGLLLLLRRRYQVAAGVLAGIPLTFVATMPAACAGIGGLAIYIWLSKKVNLKEAIGVVLPGVAVAIYIGVFYFLKAEPYQFPNTGRAETMSSLIPNSGEWKTVINIWLGTFFNFAVFYAPYALLLAVVCWAARRRLSRWPWPARFGPVVVWLVCNGLVAAAARAVGNHFIDSVQFFSNPMLPLAAAVLALLLAAALAPLPGYWAAGLAVAVLGLAAVNGYKLFSHTSPMHVTTRYSPRFLRQVAAALPGLGNRGAYLLGDADYTNTYTLTPDSYTAGTYLSDFKSDYVLASLTALDPDSLSTDPRYAHDSAQAEQNVRRSSFYRFAKFSTLAGQHFSLDSAKYLFVKKFHLRFLCASRRAILPATLQPLVQVVYVDSLSGERFYVLRPF